MEVHFNVEAIEYIKLYPSRLDNDYLWFDEEIKYIKKFFGLIKFTKVYPAGWYEVYMYDDREILSDSKDKLTSPHINYFVNGVNLYRKPQIEITLRNGHNLNYRFETDEESINYVEELKKKCKNKFEIIRYER
jgi:hypothetical protein